MEKMKVRLSVRTSLSLLVPQTVLSGMGELHLEVIHERLRSDYAINCSLGRLQVAYHETPTIVTTHTGQPSPSLPSPSPSLPSPCTHAFSTPLVTASNTSSLLVAMAMSGARETVGLLLLGEGMTRTHTSAVCRCPPREQSRLATGCTMGVVMVWKR